MKTGRAVTYMAARSHFTVQYLSTNGTVSLVVPLCKGAWVDCNVWTQINERTTFLASRQIINIRRQLYTILDHSGS
jgi:hypothetical protein